MRKRTHLLFCIVATIVAESPQTAEGECGLEAKSVCATQGKKGKRQHFILNDLDTI